ncbi:hypothetical protein QFZ34_002064 [Phyllobacterium ifriqiyense]|uniref:Uncharacterized protein n=1 Tax=Phyllobacterium ifriqiyense TaxID=314238 RepID=A0ABU0S7Z4_9HYPH|nr:hypothetical protein [Phyllobacterium ifriqiyense]MDQ0996882.1 hypothetical protein [Phyllobacterium ifriqiyense]
MARVKFTKDFDYKPTPGTTIAYLAGMEMTVKQDCADKAIAAGKAIAADKPRKETDNGEKA